MSSSSSLIIKNGLQKQGLSNSIETQPNIYERNDKIVLLRKINKIKNVDIHKKILDIIESNNDISITKNNQGAFMFFHNLTNDTYIQIHKLVSNYLEQKKQQGITETNISESYSHYQKDNDPYYNDTKLKYTNSERAVLKQKEYENEINKLSQEPNINQEEVIKEEKTIFVKSKTNKKK